MTMYDLKPNTNVLLICYATLQKGHTREKLVKVVKTSWCSRRKIVIRQAGMVTSDECEIGITCRFMEKN